MTYQPRPMDTRSVILPAELEPLREMLAKNTHENWSHQRLGDGWTYGELRDDTTKRHPSLVPYEKLSEAEKEYDRRTSDETLKAILVCGFDIVSRQARAGARGDVPRPRRWPSFAAGFLSAVVVTAVALTAGLMLY